MGEVAYPFDSEYNLYLADIIIPASNREKGYGKEGLLLLCEQAKKNGIQALYDTIALDNKAIHLFLKCGFKEIYKTNEFIMLKKVL